VVVTSLLEQKVWRLLADVPDPEIPILSVIELGVVRYVRDEQERGIAVGVSPTYTGCPATEVIQSSIKQHLQQAGFAKVRVDSVLAPPWSSDWLTDSAREKLREYGIAPPADSVDSPRRLWADPTVQCPRCSSAQTQRVSEFGSTPCKASYKCTSCLEPFEYFKCI
jgi:ring-1,2-phenylacetyl-CoA epoxidase subunit PaaD